MTSPLLSSPVPPECKEGLSSFRAARERWQKSPRKKLTPISAARKLSDVGEHPGELSSKTQDIDNAAAPYPISLSLSAPIQQQLTETTESNKKDRRLTEIITTESTTDLQFETSRPSDKTPAEPADEVSVPSRLMRAEQIETTTSDIERDTKTQVDSSASAHRDRLVAFYKQHNPSKLGSVDSTLAKYKGREEELFRKLEEKYVQGFPPPLLGEGGTTCFLEFDYEGGSKGGRVEIKLFENRTPLACENFRALCTGEKGMARAGKPLVYRNSPIHRIVPGFCIQGGDFTRGDGTGGESIYPPNSEHGDMWGKFRDEYFMSHNQKGLLSLANNGPNRNGSQFFITLKPVPYLDGKHVVFGVVTKGMHVVEEIAEIPTDKKQRPTISVVIADCGEVRGGTETNASHESGGESTTPMPAAPHGGTFGTFSVGGFITPLSFSLSRPGSSSSDPDESLRKLKTPGTVPLVEASIGANSEGSEQSTSPFGSTFVLGQLSSAITSNEPISSAKLCAVDYDYSSDSATESSNDSEDDGDTEDDDDRPAPVLSTTRNDVVSSEPLFKQFQGVNFVQAPGDEMIGLDALATAVRSADVSSASAMRDVRGRNYSSESESEDDSKYDEINSTDELDDLIYDDYDDGVQVTSPDVSDDRRVRSTKTKVSTAGADEPRSNPFAGVNFAEALIQRQAPEVSTFSFSLGTSSPSKATNSSGSYK